MNTNANLRHWMTEPVRIMLLVVLLGGTIWLTHGLGSLLAAPPAVWEEEADPPAQLSSQELLGDVTAVTVVGDYTYIGEGGYLTILDMRTPSIPVVKGRLRLDDAVGEVHAVQVVGNTAYVAVGDHSSGSGSLHIIDVSDPAVPTLLGSFATDDVARDVQVVGSTAYVASDGAGLHIVDVSDPAAPTWLGSYDVDDDASGVQVVGNTAYVAADYAGLQIVDVSDPATPTLLGHDDTYRAYDVHVVGSVAYVAGGFRGLQIIDVSDPATPTLLGHYDIYRAYDVHVVDSTVYVASWAGLHIVDVSDPAAPTRIGGYYKFEDDVRDMYVTGSSAYVAAGTDGLHVLDVQQPQVPQRAGRYPQREVPDYQEHIGRVQAMMVEDGYAYVGEGSAFTILDTRTPAAPGVLARLPMPDTVRAVQVVDSTAYVIDAYEGLQIIDVRDPATPQLLGSFETWDYAQDVYVAGNTAYVAAGDAGLQIIDVSDPAAPTLLGSFATDDDASGVQVVGNTAYVAAGDAGLQIVDVSDPTDPTLFGSYDTDGFASGVQVEGSTAYVVASGKHEEFLWFISLLIIDVSDPTTPTLLGSYDADGYARDVQVVGNTAYIATGSDGLQIIDVSDPTAPNWRGGYAEVSVAAVHVTDDVAYVAAGADGLQMVALHNPLLPTLLGRYDMFVGRADFFHGESTHVTVEGSFAYVVEGRSVSILDIQTLAHPRLLLRVAMPAEVEDVELAGNTLYVATGTTGLQMVDVSNPEIPTLFSSFDTDGAARAVHVVGSTAYVAADYAGLQIIDASNPTAPTLLGSFATNDDATAVHVAGSTACVAADDAGLQVIDVSNPAAPVLVATIPPVELSETTADEMDHPLLGPPVGRNPPYQKYLNVVVAGTRAIVVGEHNPGGMSYGTPSSDYYVHVYDVSNPATPTLLSSYETPGYAHAVQVVGSTAYVAMATKPQPSYNVFSPGGLQILDISDPTSITLLGSYETTDLDARDVQVEGNTAYIANGEAGLQVIDVSNLVAPQKHGGYPSLRYITSMHVQAENVYMTTSHGLGIGDISDATAPALFGSYVTPDYARTVQVVGNIAYVGADEEAGLQVIDISNPAVPTLLGDWIRSDNDVRAVQVVGSTAYVAAGRALLVIDVSDPTTPTLLGSFATDDFAWDVQVEGSIAYVTADEEGLQIIDVSDPTTPTLLGIFATDDDATDVQVVGSTAYVVAGRTLLVIDVSAPTAPTLLGSFATDGYVRDVHVAGSIAYVAAGGLQIIDVRDPAAPQQLMRSALPFDAEMVQVVDGLVYVAGADRLVVLRPVSLTLQGPLQGKVATTYTFTAESIGFAEDGDVTYTWQASEHDSVVHPNGGSSDVMTFSWKTPGNKTVTLVAEHGTERQVRSHTITIFRPPEQVHIQGPATAELSATVGLTAIVTPTDALISSYVWEPAPLRGQGLPTASYQWETPGTQVITLTAANAWGVVSSTHRVQVGGPPTAVQIHAPVQVVLGQNAVFTATATPAAAVVSRYRWEPAPLQGQGTDQATYHWTTPGTRVITLTAANFPVISTTHTITNMLAPPQAVHLDGSPVGVVNAPYHLHAQVTPPFATRPLTTNWQSDDHQPLVRQTDNVTASHIFAWAMPGTRTVTLTVANAANTITRTMQVYVAPSAAQSPPETVQPEGPATGEVKQSITITATVHPLTATLPVSDTFYGPYALNAGGNGRADGTAKAQRAQSSAQDRVESDGFMQQQEVVTRSITSVPLVYIWQASGYPPVVRTAGISDTFAVAWDADGVKQVEVMVVNSGGRITQTHAISLGIRLQTVEIDGPTTGEANRAYLFQATVVPTSATLLDYRWSPPPQAGQGTPKATYIWEDGGTKEVSLTAANHLGSVTASREVEVTAWNSVYLPLVTQ